MWALLHHNGNITISASLSIYIFTLLEMADIYFPNQIIFLSRRRNYPNNQHSDQFSTCQLFQKKRSTFHFLICSTHKKTVSSVIHQMQIVGTKLIIQARSPISYIPIPYIVHIQPHELNKCPFQILLGFMNSYITCFQSINQLALDRCRFDCLV